MQQGAGFSRIDPDAMRKARLRARLMAARAARRLPGVAGNSRVTGRLAGTVSPLDPAMDCDNPGLELIPEPERAAQVFQAAAAALMADDIAAAITPDQIAALPFGADMRLFALHHRHLTLGRPVSQRDHLVQEIIAVWAAGLPAPLDSEYAAPVPMPDIPATELPPQPVPRAASFGKKAGVVLTGARAVPPSERHAAALKAAMAAFPQHGDRT